MASLKFEGFLGDIPYLDSTGLPEQNSRHNKDCWFIDGKLRPIKKALDDGSVPVNTKTIYRYRPCPKDASQQYWITRTEAYNVAPSPIANDKYGRLYFSRKKYAVGDSVELPHFYDVAQLLGRSSNTDLCDGTGSAQTGVTPYSMGVPSPRNFGASMTGGLFSIATSTTATTWSFPDAYKNNEFSFLKVAVLNGTIFAAGYNGVIIYSQDDGATWATAYTPETAATFTIRSLAYGTLSGTAWYVAGCNGGKILVSSDGFSWQLPAYSADGGVAGNGNINAVVYDPTGNSGAGKFFLGTSNGIVAAATTNLAASTNPWTKNDAATALFIVTTGGTTTVNAIRDGVFFNDHVYLVGGSNGGIVAYNPTSGWATQTGHSLGDIQTVNVSTSGASIVCTTTQAYQERTLSGWQTKIKVHAFDFAAASAFQDGGGAWKNVRSAAYDTSGRIMLIGERGAFAIQTNAGSDVSWDFVSPSGQLGQTRLNDIVHTGSKYILSAGDALSSTVTTAPRYYAITFVDGYGAEGAPVLSTKLTVSPGGVFDISWDAPSFHVDENGLVLGSGGYTQRTYGNDAADATKGKFRIYRTASSGSATEFLYVDSVPYVPGTTSYTYKDVKLDEALGEVMLSTDWIPPPPKLRGLVTLPGGVLAGFVDNTLWFSEPGQPHAWPVKYQRTISAPIVGLSTFANSVLVTTIDRSYIASGIDPFNMALTELETDQSCISADSVVDMGGYAIYATPRGLVKVSNMTPEWITKQLFTPVQWGQLEPASMRATIWEGRYLAFFSGTPTYAAGGVHSFSIVPGADADGVSWYTQGADLAFTDPYDDQVYFIKDGAKKIWNGGADNLICLWRSKMLQSPESLNFGWLQIQLAGEGDAAFSGTGVSPMGNSPEGNYAKARLYSEEGYTPLVEVIVEATDHTTRQTPFTCTSFNSDGSVKDVFTGTAYDSTVRLPAGRRTRFHLVDIETNAKVLQVLMTQSAQELRSL